MTPKDNKTQKSPKGSKYDHKEIKKENVLWVVCLGVENLDFRIIISHLLVHLSFTVNNIICDQVIPTIVHDSVKSPSNKRIQTVKVAGIDGPSLSN